MEKKQLLNLMRFWCFGTFIIVFAAISVYLGLFNNGNWVDTFVAGLPVWGVTAVLCILEYYVYKWYSVRKA